MRQLPFLLLATLVLWACEERRYVNDGYPELQPWDRDAGEPSDSSSPPDVGLPPADVSPPRDTSRPPRDVGPPDVGMPRDTTPTPDAGPPGPIAWERCSFFTDQGGGGASCAMIPVPVDWERPELGEIEIFVKRIDARGRSRGQLWLLQGGPGGSGVAMESIAEVMQFETPGFDIYIPDHRGVGRSERLGCPREERPGTPAGTSIDSTEWDACGRSLQERWGQGLAGFSTSNAARDLGYVVDLTRRDADEVHVMGFSYGTYWAHRYAQLHPDQPTSLVLDSLCPPAGHCALDNYDRLFDETARDLTRYCAEDPFCLSKMGGSPWQVFARAHQRLEDGTCPVSFDRGRFRRVTSYLLRDVTLRVYLLAMAYRLDRCEPGDVRALDTIMGFFTEEDPQEPEGLDSAILGAHIIFSELWSRNPPTAAQIIAESEQLYVSPDAAANVAPGYAGWPRYDEPLADRWAQTSAAILMLNGDLDPQTPLSIAEPARQGLRGPRHHFVEVPMAAHGVIYQSPTRGGQPCGLQIISAFLRDPNAPLQDGCLTDLEPINFRGTPEYTEFLFETSDAWENDDGKPGTGASPPPGWDEIVRAYQRGRFAPAP